MDDIGHSPKGCAIIYTNQTFCGHVGFILLFLLCLYLFSDVCHFELNNRSRCAPAREGSCPLCLQRVNHGLLMAPVGRLKCTCIRLDFVIYLDGESLNKPFHGNPKPSFLGVITYNPYIGGLKFKTFIFHGFGVQGLKGI